jgi:hypothetical protein
MSTLIPRVIKTSITYSVKLPHKAYVKMLKDDYFDDRRYLDVINIKYSSDHSIRYEALSEYGSEMFIKHLEEYLKEYSKDLQ